MLFCFSRRKVSARREQKQTKLCFDLILPSRCLTSRMQSSASEKQKQTKLCFDLILPSRRLTSRMQILPILLQILSFLHTNVARRGIL